MAVLREVQVEALVLNENGPEAIFIDLWQPFTSPVCLSGAPRRLLPCGRVARQYAPKEATQLFAYLTSRRAVVCLVPPAIAALVHSAVHTQLKAFHFGALSILTAAA